MASARVERYASAVRHHDNLLGQVRAINAELDNDPPPPTDIDDQTRARCVNALKAHELQLVNKF